MGYTLKALLRRSAKDERGNVALTFGLSFLPALLVAGAAIDYSRTVTQWSNLQQATDATALTVAHAYLTSSVKGADLTAFAQTYLNGLMNGAQMVGAPVISQTNTVVCINTTFTVPTVMMKIVNISYETVKSTACSQVGQTYEVALAVDNSGSMTQTDAGGNTKMSSLQSAAKTLVSILVPSGQTTQQVGMSIVPFNSLVNVGSSAINPNIIDAAGASSIHWQNFLRPSGGTFNPTSKLDLFTGMGVPWGGCFEELPPPYTTTDTKPSTAADAMFVPYLAPDEPGSVNKTDTLASFDATGSSSTYPTYSQSTQYFYNSYLGDSGSQTSSLGSCTTSGKNSVYGTADTGTSNVLPKAGMTMVCKYGGTANPVTPSYVSVGGLITGPNYECSSLKTQPLTTSTTALNSEISNLYAGGSTSLATGFMWAWRSLSPNINAFPVSSPAAIGPQPAKSYTYGPPANQKIIILMTDGTNSWGTLTASGKYYNSFASLYETFGYLANNRISSYLSKNLIANHSSCSGSYLTAANARCAMDQLTMEACSNAKSSPSNITVYTIGFSVPNYPIDADGQALLTACASSTNKFYLATDAASIQSAFQAIASSILSLRLTQ